MEFYLLGEDEREESTGYLYLEFKRELMEEYLTIGVGMRAKQGGGFEFWGFCLNDGRRIGPDGLCLYEKAGNVLMPLTKQKLFNQIKDMDSCAEKPEKYKELVNNRLFHFRDIRQYDQLVQLLINVRTPKLSKDALRPSRVRSILNESLQVLTDEDLSAMASTLERMDGWRRAGPLCARRTAGKTRKLIRECSGNSFLSSRRGWNVLRGCWSRQKPGVRRLGRTTFLPNGPA